jgi:hypothetical protein
MGAGRLDVEPGGSNRDEIRDEILQDRLWQACRASGAR